IMVLGMVAWSARTTIVPQLLGGNDQSDTSMGEAIARIKQLEISLQNMRTSVEYHKNAYFKLEQEHETMKAALARSLPAENLKDLLGAYPNSAPLTPVDPATQAADGAQSIQ